MRCFSCDAPGTVDDPQLNRCYCTTCWNVIEDTIGRSTNNTEVTEEELEQFLWNMQEEK